ncbi:MAG: DUF2079 domain-containing protein [Okeania sp. SIO3B5]|uniref:DUF2079 domain-containing protein n=1 Tax=Okeania sp. SIO3B5 TaxID=2607811 RepID=UPI00140118AB|nr:DUF2079 domain-containing protein [Okeania sp. SIO3B5]NEO53358.1 DUF2079 domain-containing protein [Okeania sp. SIO3B5]
MTLFPPPVVSRIIIVAALIFFFCSSLRHALFYSTGFDLGIYDQVAYLISQGESPISSFLGYHHLGNHAAWAVYPLGLFYLIYPNVHWLLLVQAICLALGAWPTWCLAKQAGLNQGQAVAIAISYLLYPVVFNINLFDFHPEVMALPAILAAILAARLQRIFWFCLAIIWVLGCKAVLSLTVVFMGVWLLAFERRKFCGLVALCLGIFWFVVVTQGIIPFFSGEEVAGVGRYSYLGDSVVGIMINILLQPGVVLGKILSFETIKYICLLLLPVIWGIFPLLETNQTILPHLIPLIPTIPTIVLNVLSEVSFQRSLNYQYSLPAIGFLLLAVISCLAAASKAEENHISLDSSWKRELKIPKFNLRLSVPNFQAPKMIILWSVLIFLLLGNVADLFLYWQSLDTWQATKNAITYVKTEGGVLTDNRLAPHFTHRSTVKLLNQTQPDNLDEFDYVVLNLRHPWPDTEEAGIILFKSLQNNQEWKLNYQQNDVLVFQREEGGKIGSGAAVIVEEYRELGTHP